MKYVQNAKLIFMVTITSKRQNVCCLTVDGMALRKLILTFIILDEHQMTPR